MILIQIGMRIRQLKSLQSSAAKNKEQADPYLCTDGVVSHVETQDKSVFVSLVLTSCYVQKKADACAPQQRSATDFWLWLCLIESRFKTN